MVVPGRIAAGPDGLAESALLCGTNDLKQKG
jgi:hypothetical protein